MVTIQRKLATRANIIPSGSTSKAMGISGITAVSTAVGRSPASTAGRRARTSRKSHPAVTRLTASRALGQRPKATTSADPARGSATQKMSDGASTHPPRSAYAARVATSIGRDASMPNQMLAPASPHAAATIENGASRTAAVAAEGARKYAASTSFHT